MEGESDPSLHSLLSLVGKVAGVCIHTRAEYGYVIRDPTVTFVLGRAMNF